MLEVSPPIARDAGAEEHLHALQMVMADGFMTFKSVRDSDGRIIDFEWLFVNPAAERIVGRGRADLLGKHLLAEMPGNRDTGLFDAYVGVVESGEAWQGEFAYDLDGLDHWFRTKAAKVADGFAVAFTDITETKRAEGALLESEARLRLLVETASDAIVTIDAQNRILFANEATAKVFGHDKDLTGQNLTRLMPEYLRHVHEAGVARYLATGHRHLDWAGILVPGLHKSGREIPIEVSFGEYTFKGERRFTAIMRDVTDRTKFENDLRESRARLEFLLEAARLGDWELDLATGKARTSFQHDRYFGALEPLPEWSYEIFLSHVHPDDRAEIERKYAEAKAEDKDLRFECRVVWPDGSLHWIEAHGSLYRAADNTPLRMLGVVADITERKQAEAALRESEARFHRLADAVPQIVWVKDPAGHLVYINQRWLDYTGLSLEKSLEGTGTAVHPEDRKVVQAAWRENLALGDRFEYEMRLRRADGTYRWHLARVVPQYDADGTLLNWFGTSTDIEERKRSEARLCFQAEASAVLASALNYETTLQKVAELTVPHLADWCAVDRLNAAGGLELVAVAHADPAKAGLARLLRRRYPPRAEGPEGAVAAVRTGQLKVYPDISDDVLAQVAVDEDHLDLLRRVGFRSLVIVPLKARERITGVLTLVWSARPCGQDDVALAEELAQRAAVALDNARLYGEAREAEARLRELNKNLERRVAERTADLEHAVNELDQFAYIASHDLKAPLRAVDNLAAWIAEDAGELLPVKSREHLSKLRGRAARMERLLSDLLTYSRADRFSQTVQEVKLADLVADVTELLAPPPGFSVSFHSEVATVVTSVVPLETVLRNLIGNAFKHHHKSEGQVWVTAKDEGEVLTFEVGDDGPGIDPAFHERIFQIFQTLQPRDRLEASGIGLAVVKKIVESRGGKVGLAAAAGPGATFWFTWPKEPVPQ